MILVILALVAVLAAAPALPAQDARGTIVGRVADTSSGVIPGADIRATNAATGVAFTAKSNASGNFVLPYLPPGIYTLTIETTGFKKFVNDAVQVRINDTVDVNVQLQVGSVAETVEVKAETPLLAT
ncbi:MAG: carboxypeptidase-like regulatory domain-containing protein, partial [Acidobacteria bacterium]|nr:carboxypeptidase-like regulatory domain-containing protein [Acidobacteriota bacterium]